MIVDVMGTWYEILPPEQLWEHSVTASWKVSSVEINTTPHMLREGPVHRLASPPDVLNGLPEHLFPWPFQTLPMPEGFFPPSNYFCSNTSDSPVHLSWSMSTTNAPESDHHDSLLMTASCSCLYDQQTWPCSIQTQSPWSHLGQGRSCSFRGCG